MWHDGQLPLLSGEYGGKQPEVLRESGHPNHPGFPQYTSSRTRGVNICYFSIIFKFDFDFVLMIKLQNRKFYLCFISIWALCDVHVFCVTSGSSRSCQILIVRLNGCKCSNICQCKYTWCFLLCIHLLTLMYVYVKAVLLLLIDNKSSKILLMKVIFVYLTHLLLIYLLYSNSVFLYESTEIGNS